MDGKRWLRGRAYSGCAGSLLIVLSSSTFLLSLPFCLLFLITFSTIATVSCLCSFPLTYSSIFAHEKQVPEREKTGVGNDLLLVIINTRSYIAIKSLVWDNLYYSFCRSNWNCVYDFPCFWCHVDVTSDCDLDDSQFKNFFLISHHDAL